MKKNRGQTLFRPMPITKFTTEFLRWGFGTFLRILAELRRLVSEEDRALQEITRVPAQAQGTRVPAQAQDHHLRQSWNGTQGEGRRGLY